MIALSFSKLADVASINPKLTSRPADDELISFVPMSAVDAETGTTESGEERTFGEVSKGYTVFSDNDILVAKITPCFENGKIAQARLKYRMGVGSTEFHVIRPNRSRLDARYLLHFLRRPAVRVAGERRMTGSAGQRRVPEAFLAGLSIPTPPLPEQKRIADVLDRVDELRAKRRGALFRLDDLTRSIVASALSDIERANYPVRALGDVVERVTVGHVGPTSQYFREEGVPFLRTGNIGSSEIDLSDLRYITPEFHKRLAKSTLRNGDLLVSRVISDEVRCAIVPAELDGANCANAIIIRPGNAMSGIFIQHLITSPFGQSAFLRRRVGSAQSVVNTQVLQSWRVPVPPLGAQTEFAASISAVNSVRARQRANLAELDALFASLQDRAFRGLL